MDLVILIVFILTTFTVIFMPFERSLIAFAGLIAMIVLSPNYSFVDAFKAIDWNVMMILFGAWILSGYLSKSGLPEYIVYYVSRNVGSYSTLLLCLTLIASFITMFVDNVLVILLLGGLAVRAAIAARRDPLVTSMIIGLAANYMGTALLLGDLPPQLLHSIAGAEFLDFIWFREMPGSFILLTISFILTLLVFYRFWFRGDSSIRYSELFRGEVKYNKIVAYIAIIGFIAFITLASIRPILGVELGAIAVSVAITVASIIELIKVRTKREDIPSFEEIIRDLEWRVIIFYAALFSLVGGLKKGGVLSEISYILVDYIAGDLIISYTIIYWLVALLSTVIEHDAIVLIMLLTIRDLAQTTGIDPWPLYWAVVWSGTLGSNATIAGAPALYLSLILAEKEKGRASWKEWMKITVPFTITSLLIHYIITLILFQTIYN
ncbi:MAG: SLC13 family permease [Acidilobaceae archaeon]